MDQRRLREGGMSIAGLLTFKRPEMQRLVQEPVRCHAWNNQHGEVWSGVWMFGLKEERNHEN